MVRVDAQPQLARRDPTARTETSTWIGARTEHVGNSSLEGYLLRVAQENIPHSLQSVLALMRMILLAYESVHDHHILHIDVKADNMLVLYYIQ